jgi:hypothetical protein
MSRGSSTMMQQCIDNEQRERLYKHESEQREEEYQLHLEEMENLCKEACLQRQMINITFMLMLSQNRGGQQQPAM